MILQIYAMPVFDMIETVLVKKLRFQPSFILRLISRSAYVCKSFEISFSRSLLMSFPERNSSFSHFFAAAATMFIAITFPFFGGLLSFFGGFAFAPTTYFVSLFRSLHLSLCFMSANQMLNCLHSCLCSSPA